MVVREREPTLTKPGKIQICLDPSQTLNKALLQPYHGNLFCKTYLNTNTSIILSLWTTTVTSTSWTSLTTLINHHRESHQGSLRIPLHCLTDNRPQFVSHEYQASAQTLGFEHVTSSPYLSCSNGKAEAAVNDAKTLLKKSQDIYLAVLNIRNTLPRSHSFSPVR